MTVKGVYKTHCIRGHEFNEENTKWRTRGTGVVRACKACTKHHEAARYLRTNGRFSCIKDRAKYTGKVCTLTEQEYADIVEDASCFYCSAELPPRGGGLDRVDSKGGYTADNVVACCAACNADKLVLTQDEFFAVIRHRVDAGTLGKDS